MPPKRPHHAPLTAVIPAPRAHPPARRSPTLPTTRPCLLTIGVHRLPGLRTRHTPTLVAGYDLAARQLDRAQPAHPTLILLDLAAEEPGFPELAAPQVAAVLAQRMHEGELHLAWLIGLAASPTEDADAEAYLAGCHLVLHPPLRDTILTGLVRLASQPATLPATDRATRAYQRAAARVLAAVRAAQIPLWTAEDVAILLGALTRYPVEAASAAETTRVLRALGGVEQAYGRLHAIVDAWRGRFPLHAAILELFLHGAERREIVRHVVTHQHYEDSRVYAGITTLPARIAKEWCLAPGQEEEGETS